MTKGWKEREDKHHEPRILISFNYVHEEHKDGPMFSGFNFTKKVQLTAEEICEWKKVIEKNGYLQNSEE